MKYKALSFTIAALAFTAGSMHANTVLTFDDIDAADNGGVIAMPTNYGGASWSSNWWVWDSPGNAYYPYASDPNAAYLNDQQTAAISFAAPVTFESAWISGFAEGQTITAFDASNNQIGTVTPVGSDASTFALTVHENWANVSSLVFSSPNNGGQEYFILDNLTFSAAGQAVPDFASSAVLFVLGLAGLVAVRRRAVV
ncbi:MAG TPA: hypothetical protein VGL42_14505 [Opitutaceae bacterium]|jgi:hypothetical protein